MLLSVSNTNANSRFKRRVRLFYQYPWKYPTNIDAKLVFCGIEIKPAVSIRYRSVVYSTIVPATHRYRHSDTCLLLGCVLAP